MPRLMERLPAKLLETAGCSKLIGFHPPLVHGIRGPKGEVEEYAQLTMSFHDSKRWIYPWLCTMTELVGPLHSAREWREALAMLGPETWVALNSSVRLQNPQ